MNKKKWVIFLIFLAIHPVLLCCSCRKKSNLSVSAAPSEPSLKRIDLQDVPIQPFQVELLEFAYQTASAIPSYPHIKDRSRAQYRVVEAALKLDQPQRALRYIEGIQNWRRGAGYADLAMYCAQHHKQEGVQHFLDLANKIAEEGFNPSSSSSSSETMQEWRRDHIKAKIAQTYAWLGMMDKAQAFQTGVVESEQGKVAEIEAQRATDETFEQQIKQTEDLVKTGHLDVQKNAISSYVYLYDRFYQDHSKRDLVEEKIVSSWKSVPAYLQIKFLMKLSKIALAHDDATGALKFVDQAHQLLESGCWLPEDRIPLSASLAALRFQAGQTEEGRIAADTLLVSFEEQKNKIVNIFRPETLIPLAEAYNEMGDVKMALSVYKKAVEEGVENPNSRPRAEDISAVALSMALSAVEPDTELWARLREIQKGLGDPW